MSRPVEEKDISASLQIMGDPAIKSELVVKDSRTFLISVPNDRKYIYINAPPDPASALNM